MTPQPGPKQAAATPEGAQGRARDARASGGWGVVAGIVVVTVLLAWAAFALRPSGFAAEDVRRSALRTTPDGVAALHRAIARLGTPTAMRLTPLVDAEPLRGTLVILQPLRRPSPREVHELLEWIRGGGTLIHSPRGDSPILDSLGLVRHEVEVEADSVDAGMREVDDRPGETDDPADESGWPAESVDRAPGDVPVTADEPAESDAMSLDAVLTATEDATQGAAADPEPGDVPLWSRRHPLTEGLPMSGPSLYAIAPDTASDDDQDEDAGVEEDDAASPDPVAFAPLLLTAPDPDGHRWTAVAAIPLGEGRIIGIADAEPLSNRFADTEPVAVLAARAAIAYTSPGDTVYFDEFSQGLGRSRSPARATTDFLLDTPVGRASLHLSLVVLLALACAGMRFGAALTSERVERRSSLEHVAALAAVYESAQARETAAVLMLARLARASRLPPPQDGEEALSLLRRLEDRTAAPEPLRLIRRGLEARPVDLPAIARGIDDHTQRSVSP